MSTERTIPIEVVGAGPLTPAEEQAEAWAERVDDDVLESWRGIAKAWMTTVSTLLSLLGAGTVLGADDAVRALEDPWALTYGVCVAAALAAGAGAIFAAHTASEPTGVTVDATVDARLARYDARVQRAKRWLLVSRIATACALALLAASFGVRWFAPTDSRVPGATQVPAHFAATFESAPAAVDPLVV